jgi:hypothetical protein
MSSHAVEGAFEGRPTLAVADTLPCDHEDFLIGALPGRLQVFPCPFPNS